MTAAEFGRNMPPMALLISGLILLGIGLERLLNAYLRGASTETASWPLLIGIVCATLGTLLLVAYLDRWRRR